MKVIISVVFSVLYVSSVAAQTACGISKSTTSFILNGTLAERGKWPWIASLHLAANDEYFCGGTLLASNLVVTAAHCVHKKFGKRRTAEEIVVKLGKFDLSARFERGSLTKFLTDIVIHKNWSSTQQSYDGDIAILILENPADVEASSTITPICLWDGHSGDLTGQKGTVIGWGKSELSEANNENRPRRVEMKIVNNAECFEKSRRFIEIASDRTYCADGGGREGTCFGDSGSAMVVAHKGFWFFKGIVSSGFQDSQGQCDVSDFSLFTDVLKYTSWIKEVAKIHDASLPSYKVSSRVEEQEVFGKEIFCFVESWAGDREGNGKIAFEDLKPELCTFLVFLNAGIDGDSIDSSDTDAFELYKRFNNLKKSHKHLKTLLCVGSWNEGSVKYSQLAKSPERRKKFAKNSAAFLKLHGFDGMHLHWEYPGHRGGSLDDKQNFPLLLRDLKEVYKTDDLYLTAMTRVWYDAIRDGYDLRNIAKHADKLLLMNFDLAGYWDNKIGFHAPLRGVGENNIESREAFFTAEGVPAEKIVIGIPFHGRTFVTDSDGENGMLSQSAFAGPLYQENGFLGYNELCQMRKLQKFETRFDARASQALSKFTKDGLTHVVTYDTPRSVANKVKFAVEKRLGGVWIWFVTSDDSKGECEIDTTTFADFPNGITRISSRDFSLLRTVNAVYEFYSPRKNQPELSDRIFFPDD